jgi:hypothetical protein
MKRSILPVRSLLVLSAILAVAPLAHAADDDDFNAYKIQLDALWFYTYPTGTMHGEGQNGYVDFTKDFGFSSYSTFAGKLDWKFTRKNHLLLSGSPLSITHTTILTRTITFQGQTFDVGLQTKTSLSTSFIAPGYQYDIIRRKRGNLGIVFQVDLLDTTAKISAAAQVTGDGVQHAAVSASGSLLAPIPVAGPNFRFYLTDSPRVFVDGNLYGMYLFGYGNFLSTEGDIGVTLNKHIAFKAGYQLGTKLTVNNSNSRVGINLTQKGPLAGIEFSL